MGAERSYCTPEAWASIPTHTEMYQTLFSKLLIYFLHENLPAKCDVNLGVFGVFSLWAVSQFWCHLSVTPLTPDFRAMGHIMLSHQKLMREYLAGWQSSLKFLGTLHFAKLVPQGTVAKREPLHGEVCGAEEVHFWRWTVFLENTLSKASNLREDSRLGRRARNLSSSRIISQRCAEYLSSTDGHPQFLSCKK